MKPNRQLRQSNQRGSILVVCMVMAALGTIGVAAWVSLLDARSHQVEADLSAVERRVVYNNSRALAYRALYANHLHAGVPLASDITYTLPDDLGEATIRSYSDVPLQQGALVRHSRNGATPVRSFSTDVTVEISDGTAAHPWEFQLRNYNPVLGGELLSVLPPVDYTSTDPLVAGDIRVEGRAALWDAVQRDFNSGIRADEFLLPNDIVDPTTFSDTSSASTLPLNYPIPLQTTGMGISGPAYEGELNITRSTGNQHNDHVTRLTNTGTSLTLGGNSSTSIGPGFDTVIDGTNDAALEIQIASESPASLMVSLAPYFPLSSRVLEAVVEKNNPPFSEDQIYEIFENHIPIPNDALTHLMGATYQSRIGSRLDELNRANGTWLSIDGAGVARVYLDRNELPHLLLDQVRELRLLGQLDSTAATAAESMIPVGVVVANSIGHGMENIFMEGDNYRRLVLAISTETLPPASTASYTPRFVFTGPSAFPRWHTIFDLQNTGGVFENTGPAGAIIVGGIRTNRKIDVISGRINIKQEHNEAGYESLLSRNAWIEAYSR